MSTDLDFFHDLPKLCFPAPIKIQAKQQQITASAVTAGGCGSDDGSGGGSDDDVSTKIDDGNNEECRTPTSKENKIPAVETCPPAPRKPKRRGGVSCKRKLNEFFEMLHREEVETFLRSGFEMVAAKRRCPCI